MTTNATTSSTSAPNAGAGRQLVGHAWPTDRPVYSYTTAEIAAGVDIYTQFLKRRKASVPGGEPDEA